jgi:hypothetical protein
MILQPWFASWCARSLRLMPEFLKSLSEAFGVWWLVEDGGWNA